MLVSLLLLGFSALQSSTGDISTWASLMPRHATPQRGFDLPKVSALRPLLRDRSAVMAERISALKALAYLEASLTYSELKAMKRSVHASDALVAYVRCLTHCGEDARPALTKYMKDRSPEIRAEAVYGLVRYFGGGQRMAREILADRKLHSYMRVAAIRGLADSDLAMAQIEIMRRITSESEEVLIECLEILRRDLNPDHIKLLIEVLAMGRSRATNEAAAMLVQITGYRIGNNYRSWRLAYLRHKAEGTVMRASKQATGQLRTVAYMGIPIFSDNICFVLDSSSSMTARMSERKRMTRAMKVIEEFEKMLPILPSTAAFNIVFFESLIHVMYDELTPVNAGTKEYAAAFVSTNNFAGGTDLFGGISRAFELENIEEIIVLSDGEPSVGEFKVPWEIMLEIERLNRWRNVRISSISFSAPPVAENLMYMIAAHNLGHFRDID
ncbi:MAG: hypothetical protein ACI84O_001328 [Myxococcota bacterium]|jgi:hypothetical protein